MPGFGISVLGAALALLFATPVVEAAHRSHCTGGEVAVFTCPIGDKTVSLCASADRSFSSGTLQYRFGRIGKVEMNYPEKAAASRKAFRGGLALYGSGGSSYVRFVRAGVAYTLYRYSGIGHQEDGLVVSRGDRKLTAAKCPNFAVVDDEWWLQIDKGALPPDPDEPVVP